MSLAPYIRIVARGKGRARPLSREEACEAMRLILDGQAEAEAVGALLMVLRYRGETASEVAGFVEAARKRVTAWQETGASLDWPSYAAGRTRGHPYFLLAAKLVARAGHSVLLHGWNSHQQGVASVRDALGALDIPTCDTPLTAREALAKDGIAYAPLENLDPAQFDLLRLRDTLGLRSIVNTVLRLLNPAAAPVSVQGVFHPPYRGLQSDVGALLGQPRQCVIKGGGGEFERHPAKETMAFLLENGHAREAVFAPLRDETRRLHDDPAAMPPPAALWAAADPDPFALAIVIGTTSMALATLDPTLSPCAAEAMATRLWESRHCARIAA